MASQTQTVGRFTLERLSASTWKIVQDDGKGQYPFMYAILGADKCVVIDTGVGTGGLKKVLDAKVNTEHLPYLVICTHVHFDHVGNNYEFLVGDDGSAVAAAESPPYAAPCLCMGNRDPKTTNNYDLFSLGMAHGVTVKPFKVTRWLEDGGCTHQDRGCFPPLSPADHLSHPQTAGLPPGATVTLDDANPSKYNELVILHTPGHSIDSISIWFAREKRLFVGDLLYPYTAISLSALGSAPQDYTSSLRKVIAFVEEEGAKPLPTADAGHTTGTATEAGAGAGAAADDDAGAAEPHEAPSSASASATPATATEGVAAGEAAADVAGSWRERLEAAAAPVKAAYQERTCRAKSTNQDALAERNAGLVAAFEALGIPHEVAMEAIKRGSGAIDYLLEKGGLEEIGRTAGSGGGGAEVIEVVDMTQAGDPNTPPPPPPAPAALTEQAQMFAMTLGMAPLDLVARVDPDTLLELCGGSLEVALDMFLSSEAQCRELAPPKAGAPAGGAGGAGGGAVEAAEMGGVLPVPSTGPPTEVTLACGHVEAILPTSSLTQVLNLCTGITSGATIPSGFIEDGVCEYSDGMFTIVAPTDVDWTLSGGGSGGQLGVCAPCVAERDNDHVPE